MTQPLKYGCLPHQANVDEIITLGSGGQDLALLSCGKDEQYRSSKSDKFREDWPEEWGPCLRRLWLGGSLMEEMGKP